MNFSFSRIFHFIITLISTIKMKITKRFPPQLWLSWSIGKERMPHWHTIGTVWDSRSNSQTNTNSSFHFSSFQIVWFIIQDEEERPRPEFAAKAPYLEKNPITGVREPAFPKAVRCLSLTTNGCFLSLVAQDCFPTEFKHTIPSCQFSL